MPRIISFDRLKLRVRKINNLRSEPSKPCPPQLVCSYNWVVDETKEGRPLTRINVPGDVRVYRPRRVKFPRVVDMWENGHKTEGNLETCQISYVPFEALFLATRIMNPTFRFDKVDLVIPLSLLTKLLLHHFQCQGVEPVGGTRFDRLNKGRHNVLNPIMYTVQNTMFIHSPIYRKYQEKIQSVPHVSGSSFEKQVTTLRGAKSDNNTHEYHYRAIQCHLGGLSCVILYEADARWLSDGLPDDTAAISHAHNPSSQQPALYSLDKRVPVFRQGSGAPQSDIVELKVRHIKKYRGRKIYPPWGEHEELGIRWFHIGYAKANLYVYFTHTGRVITGYLKKDRVESIAISRTAQVIKKLDSELSPHLPRLAELFRRLREIALEAKRPCQLRLLGSSSFIAVDTEIPRPLDKHPIPREIVETFWERAKNPKTANAPTAGKPQQSNPTTARSKDAASLLDSGNEMKKTKGVNARTHGRPHSTLPEEPKLSPLMEWVNLALKFAAQISEAESHNDHPPTRSSLQPTTTTTTTIESPIEGSRLVGNPQAETKQRTQSDGEIIMEAREVLRLVSQRLAELAGVLDRL